MKFRDPKSATLIANQLMSDIELAREHSLLNPDISNSLVYLARCSIGSLVEQVAEGVISVNEWHAMLNDVKEIVVRMLTEGQEE